MTHPEFFFRHIVLECLMVISNASCKRLSRLAALNTLLPYLRVYQLENIGSSLLWILAVKDPSYLSDFETARQQPMNYETGLYKNKIENFFPGNYMTDEERTTLIKECIEQEKQRLQSALFENDGKSMKLYSACISLPRVSRWSQKDDELSLLEQSIEGAMSINNKLVRLDALCMIAFYSHVDYNQILVNKNRSLHEEINYQLHDIYPDLPLLSSLPTYFTIC